MFDYTKVPDDHMTESLKNYLEKGILPGDFLTAVVCNDLFDACVCADENNRQYIYEWCQWIWNEAPVHSYGSRQAVYSWVRAHADKREGNT